MPWNRNLRRRDHEHQRRSELIQLVEAAGASIGIVAREAGYEFNSATTGATNGEVSHSVLYEASPEDVAESFPQLAEDGGPFCIDLWIHWHPEFGHLEVDLLGFGGPHGLQIPTRPDLEEASRRRVRDKGQLLPALRVWSEALEHWFQENESN